MARTPKAEVDTEDYIRFTFLIPPQLKAEFEQNAMQAGLNFSAALRSAMSDFNMLMNERRLKLTRLEHESMTLTKEINRGGGSTKQQRRYG